MSVEKLRQDRRTEREPLDRVEAGVDYHFDGAMPRERRDEDVEATEREHTRVATADDAFRHSKAALPQALRLTRCHSRDDRPQGPTHATLLTEPRQFKGAEFDR